MQRANHCKDNSNLEKGKTMQLTRIVESVDESAVVIFRKKDDDVFIRIKDFEINILVDDIKEVVKGKKMREIII